MMPASLVLQLMLMCLQSDALTLSAVTPSRAPAEGGTVLTLTGTGFLPGVVVTVGGVRATEIRHLTPTTLTCLSPAGPPGSAVIRVTIPDGRAASLLRGFTYFTPPPVVPLQPERFRRREATPPEPAAPQRADANDPPRGQAPEEATRDSVPFLAVNLQGSWFGGSRATLGGSYGLPSSDRPMGQTLGGLLSAGVRIAHGRDMTLAVGGLFVWRQGVSRDSAWETSTANDCGVFGGPRFRQAAADLEVMDLGVFAQGVLTLAWPVPRIASSLMLGAGAVGSRGTGSFAYREWCPSSPSLGWAGSWENSEWDYGLAATISLGTSVVVWKSTVSWRIGFELAYTLVERMHFSYGAPDSTPHAAGYDPDWYGIQIGIGAAF